MGLDWIPQDIAKPGHEAEFERLRRRIGWKLPYFTPRWKKRYSEIIVPPYSTVGAPRVGFDSIADDWAVARYTERKNKDCSETEFLQRLHGYYVLELVKCHGLPQFTHGGMYDGVDYTSFRGQFVILSKDLITDELRDRAYRGFSPAEGVAYGASLLDRATVVASGHGLDVSTAACDPNDDSVESIAGQIEIFRAASEWFSYWGGKGHRIEPWA